MPDSTLKERLYKKPALIGYMIKCLKEKAPEKQVGKTFIQKIIYLLTKDSDLDFHYALYHYGPYSFELSHELGFARDSGLVKIDWRDDEGYFLSTTKEMDKYNDLLSEEEKNKIEKLAYEYLQFNAKELSIVATAYFLLDHNNIDKSKLTDLINQIKPYISKEDIREILERASIL